MRKHPLLALFSTIAALTTFGTASGHVLDTAAVAPTDGASSGSAPASGVKLVALSTGAHDSAEHETTLTVAFFTHDTELGTGANVLTGPPALTTASVERAVRRLAQYRRQLARRTSRDHQASAGLTALAPSSPGPSDPASTSRVWLALRTCESGDNYRENTGNGYYGAYQFSLQTWLGIGFSGLPSAAPQLTQDRAALLLRSRAGWGAWPQCSSELGLR